VSDGTTQAARLAENEARFRDANERVGATAARLELEQPVPFLCECGRSSCMTVIHVLPRDYERVRAFPNHFIYAGGHEHEMPGSHRIETLEHAVIVEKLGEAARVAQETDPRHNDGRGPSPRPHSGR
jgi:hypothetical protein